MTHSLELIMPTASSSGRFLRLPTTFPTLDSLYLHGSFRSVQRPQPFLFPLHRTYRVICQRAEVQGGVTTYLCRETLVAGVAELDGF